MINASVHTLSAIDRLSANPDFITVVAAIESGKATAIRQLLDGTNTVSVHKSQGYCQALEDFLQLVTTAKEALSALGQR